MLDCITMITIIIILYFLNSKFVEVICAKMFYMGSLCVLIYANKDYDDDYYYCR